IASYVLLPVLLLRFARGVHAHARESIFARLVGLLGLRRPALVCAAGLAIVGAAGAVTWHYVTADPFEYDLTHIRSVAPDAVAARDWMRVAVREFGRGLWTRTYVLVERADEVGDVIAALAASRATPDGRASLGEPLSILDVIPPDQPQKLAVLAEIRHLLDDPGRDELAESERAELAELRPPDE